MSRLSQLAVLPARVGPRLWSYVAGRRRNRDAVAEVADRIEANGFTVEELDSWLNGPAIRD